MDQKFLLIESELLSSLMADRKLVQKIIVSLATVERVMAVVLILEYVWLIEKCDEDQLLFHMHFASKHTVGMVFAK